jgi:hypothetical protein
VHSSHLITWIYRCYPHRNTHTRYCPAPQYTCLFTHSAYPVYRRAPHFTHLYTVLHRNLHAVYHTVIYTLWVFYPAPQATHSVQLYHQHRNLHNSVYTVYRIIYNTGYTPGIPSHGRNVYTPGIIYTLDMPYSMRITYPTASQYRGCT